MDLSHFGELAAEHFGLTPAHAPTEMSDGHVNRTVVVECDEGTFVIQEINAQIFTRPAEMMANVEKIVTRQAETKLGSIDLRRTVDDQLVALHNGSPWRCYRFVDGSATPPILTRDDAQSTARAFGRFARAIDGLELVEHLPGYHDFDARVASLHSAIDRNASDRLRECEHDVADLLAVVDRLRVASPYHAWREAPVRNAHNDAKGPNCIIGSARRTIIDLDTAMPGTILADVGELVRSSTRHLGDAPPQAIMAQVASVNRGFLAGYGGELAEAEHAAMLLAGPLMAAENAVRFMSDHLDGDTYYGATAPDENRVRSIEQLRLAERLIAAIELATSGALGAA